MGLCNPSEICPGDELALTMLGVGTVTREGRPTPLQNVLQTEIVVEGCTMYA